MPKEPDNKILIKEIQIWLKEQNIKNARQDREMILRFITGCKYDINKVKIKMRNYYEMRANCPELFHGRDPFLKNLETLFDLGVLFPLPVKDSENGTLIIVKAAINDPKEIPMTDVFKAGVMSVDLLMELDETIAGNGVGVIIDMTGVSLGHAMQMTPTLIWKMVKLWQDCYPVRIKSMDFINCPSSIDLVLNVFRKFLRENLKSRLRTHGSQISSLHAIHDPKLLPQEYGGNLESTSNIISNWRRQIQTHRQWFMHDETIL